MAREISLGGVWKAQQVARVPDGGGAITRPGFDFSGWIDARVPGTVLGALVDAGVYPDPFYGVNGEQIPDASSTGGLALYTYWFATSFELDADQAAGGVRLDLRGINYTADVYLNGQQIGGSLAGMFLRRRLDVSGVAIQGTNLLAVQVTPPDPPGIPDINGGQPGTPNIGESVTMRYTVGWDWVRPVADRNCGLWDQVSLRLGGPVWLDDPHVTTTVLDGSGQLTGNAVVGLSADLWNRTGSEVTGVLACTLVETGQQASTSVTLAAGQQLTVALDPLTVEGPDLWWPNGLGAQPLYTAELSFTPDGGTLSDAETVRFGMRQITSRVGSSPLPPGKVITVNGRDVFIRGADWIGTDAMLRSDHLSAERYGDEVLMFAEMNLNMLRVWGGGIAERPEFYDACDRAGILVMQDFWISGEFTGPFPSGWQETFLASARDTIRMLRNHPSLCFWSGGNEAPPPPAVDTCLRYYVEGSGTPTGCGSNGPLDGTRSYVSYSTSGPEGLGFGDGPYGILVPSDFFALTSCPFNPEVGSVGTPTARSVRRMMSSSAADDFPTPDAWNATWTCHDYITYGPSQPQPGGTFPCSFDQGSEVSDQVGPYGEPKSLEEFTYRAQLVNLQQYQALFEGFAAGMWTKYTGVLCWKGQNPWPGLRGSFYDWYLAQNGGYYGVRRACEPVHAQLDLSSGEVQLVNVSADDVSGTLSAEIFDLAGGVLFEWSQPARAAAGSLVCLAPDWPVELPTVYLLRLSFVDTAAKVCSRHVLWRSTAVPADYTALGALDQVALDASGDLVREGDAWRVTATLSLPSDAPAVAFAVRLQLLRADAGQVDQAAEPRVLPAWYEDGYFTLMPGESRTLQVACRAADTGGGAPTLVIEAFNVPPFTAPITFNEEPS